MKKGLWKFTPYNYNCEPIHFKKKYADLIFVGQTDELREPNGLVKAIDENGWIFEG